MAIMNRKNYLCQNKKNREHYIVHFCKPELANFYINNNYNYVHLHLFSFKL